MNLSLPLAFTVGLLSTLHCAGMCGGIVGALSYGLPPEIRRNTALLSLFLLIYSSGRILSYVIAGALMGTIGSGLLQMLGPGQGHRWLQWTAALIVTLIGLHITGWLPRLALVERMGVPLWRKLEPLGRHLLPVSTLPRALGYGLVWGWLPCGLVYTMLLSTASRAGSLDGALYMLAFGLGTLPAVLATGLLAGKLLKFARTPRLKIAVGCGIIVLGLLTLVYPQLLDLASDGGGGLKSTSG
ncbi:MAG: sulfite exporter TauE/SafE family protein [Gammaproteobacteria bacterium]|nr:sulfite exporter TauE/SafE family protein [Gammaproteobacteria bacterium]HXK55571.1 sulfite exporter TauE/SafE family protein [Gammaproteobacteria bacterium]